MAAAYHDFTVVRPNEPDYATLQAQLRSNDATIGIQHTRGTTLYTLKKNTLWTQPQINAAQSTIQNCPAESPQLTSQAIIDQFDITQRASLLTLLDEINILRTNAGLAARTPQQLLQGIKDKANTLS
jgi:hypothetical protein